MRGLSHDTIQKLPNILTILRVVCVVPFVAGFLMGGDIWRTVAAVAISLAAITDALDGYTARRFGAVSSFGSFLDPVADKLVVIIGVALLAVEIQNTFITLATLIIIARELVISAVREWMNALGERLPVSRMGKIKTIFQMVAVIGFFWLPISGKTLPVHLIGYLLGDTILEWLIHILRVGVVVCYYIAAILGLISMVTYLRQAWPYIMRD